MSDCQISRVISGGQTGCDQAALRAARKAGILTGGTAPNGWHTEDGPARWLAACGLVECAEPGYPARTRANVRDADATLILTQGEPTGGTRLTLTTCRVLGKPYLVVDFSCGQDAETITLVQRWLVSKQVKILNVAGPRESGYPGVGKVAEVFLGEVLAPSSVLAEGGGR